MCSLSFVAAWCFYLYARNAWNSINIERCYWKFIDNHWWIGPWNIYIWWIRLVPLLNLVILSWTCSLSIMYCTLTISLYLLSLYCTLSLSLCIMSHSCTLMHKDIIAERISTQLNPRLTVHYSWRLYICHKKEYNFRFFVIILHAWVVKMLPCINEYMQETINHAPCRTPNVWSLCQSHYPYILL